ncbi:MAG: hypothetical protein QF752_03835 [Planctomycetota bacterium]|jgi:hypothetical protein|nr:hypothetical protein [Planctomycetota bacterium]
MMTPRFHLFVALVLGGLLGILARRFGFTNLFSGLASLLAFNLLNWAGFWWTRKTSDRSDFSWE